MPRIAEQAVPVTGGVDTHADVHVAAVVDQVGRVLGTRAFPADTSGYAGALAWMRAHGELAKVGVEGTGSYGCGLARHLAAAGVRVVEVIRPNRQARRQRGKSDAADAMAAALAALNGEASGVPKSHDGAAESIRMLRVARCGAVKARTQAGNQLRDLIVTAPEALRQRLANSALWTIAMTRLAHDPRTKAYLARRTAEGKTKKEIIRCLKRYIAREIYKALCRPQRPSRAPTLQAKQDLSAPVLT
jgi:transposase